VEKRRTDLNGAGVRVVNVALILQGIRHGPPKRRTPSQVVWLDGISNGSDGTVKNSFRLTTSTPRFFVSVADKGLTFCVSAFETYGCGSLGKC
jgi:hypothetical protein